MSIEDLLKPRYKVIADYPGCPYPVGEILVVAQDGELYSIDCGYSFTVVKIMEKEVNKFTHLVRKMQWWEDRKPEDLPEYVRFYMPSPQMFGVGKVEKWAIGHHALVKTDFDIVWRELSMGDQPATLEEYESFINSQIKG